MNVAMQAESTMHPRTHNNPPDPIETITAAFEDARTEAESWLDGQTVQTEGQMNAVDELRGLMRQWRITLEKGQKDATAPLHDAWKREGEKWKPTIEDAKMIESGLVALVDGFKRKLAAEKEAEARAKWQAAEAARKEAEAKVAAANVADIEAQREARAALDAADQARAQASAAQKDTVKGMRLVTKYEIADYRALLNWIAKNDRDAITAFIEDYARKNHKAIAHADGLNVWTAKEAY